MAEFSVDVSELLKQLQNAQTRLTGLGRSLDQTERSFQTVSNSMVNEAKKLVDTLKNISINPNKFGNDATAIENYFKMMSESSDLAATKMISDLNRAALSVTALSDKTHKLHGVIKNTEAFKMQEKYLKEMLTEGQKASFELAKLRREATLIHDPLTAAGRQQKILNAAIRESADYAAKQQAAYVKNTVALNNFEDSTTRYNRAAQNMIKELVAQERHESALASQREVSHRNLERRLQETKVARDQHNSSVAQALRIEQQKLRAEQEETRQLEALEQKLHSNTVALRLYNTTKAKAARDAELALRLARQETDASQKLAQAKKQEEIINRQIANGTYQERERTAQLSKIKQEEIRLRERLRMVKSEEYRATVQLKQAIKQEEDAIRRSTEATRQKANQMRISNQVAAGTRAMFAGLQTSFGMFTSATIATATAVYGVTRAIRSTIEVGTEFSASMARTAAIMGGAAANDPVMFEALENKVRSLAKITQFTAVETAGAMTELGQAGLTAGQAMVALEPTLNLAAIGQLSMATAADHATNIMMIFGKEAQDLTHIVDVMATAVTNSNTTVDQLANALTYAGPAAQSAGFSFEDTVAVTEALANSGFKASRSGTAMRRLFVSLVNPTKKGQAVLDDLNVSVLNMDGSTKGLVELVNELSDAMANLSGAEQLAAIQNLVGVYATSPVAALMAQTENLNKLRQQQDNVSEAATRMRERIEESLKFDAKMALSAFQEAQLHVFDRVEDRLQVFVMNTANYLTSLTQPLSDDSDVTKLDEYIHRLQIVGGLALSLGAIFAAKKTSGWLTQASQELSGQGGLVAGLVSASSRWREYATSVQMAQMATGRASASASVTAAAMNAMAIATRTAAAAMNALAIAMQWIGRIAMVAGIIYSAYQAISTMFGPGVEEKIERQKTRIDELAESYTKLKRESREAALREQEVFNTEQAEKATKHITELRAELNRLNYTKALATSHGRNTLKLDQDIAGLESQIQTLEALRDSSVKSAEQYRDTLQNQDVNYRHTLNVLTVQRQEITTMLAQLAGIDNVLASANTTDTERNHLIQKRGELLKEVQDQQVRIMATTDSLSRQEAFNAKQAVDNTKLREEAQASLLRQMGEFEAQREASTSKIEKHIQAEARLNQLAGERKEWFLVLAELERQGVSDGEALATARKELTANTEHLARATNDYYTSQEELHKLQDQAAQAMEDYAFSQMNSAEKAEYLNQKIRELTEARAEEVQAALLQNAAYHTSAEGMAQNAEFIMKLIDLNQKLAGIREERAPRQSRPQKSPEDTRLEAALKLNEQLIQKYDAVGHSAKQLEKNTSDLLFAYEKGKITQDEYNKGVQQLASDHHKVVLAQDKTYQSTMQLLEAYKGGDTAKYADELARVISLYEKGTISAGMYTQVVSQINDEIRSGVKGPEVGIQLSPNASLFQEAMSTVIDYSQGTSKWEKIEQDHAKELALALQHQEELRALQIQAAHDEIMDAEELSAKLTSIHEEREAKKKLISEASAQKQEQITAQSAQYQKGMAKMVLASLAGSMADLVGMYAKTGEDATAAQKAAFVAQKALGVAQIILMTEVAAAQAKGDMSIPFTSTKIALASMIRAQGYASAGFAAALAIGEVSGNYSGAYDKGGYIPTGKFGIVGEYGPEIVNGPAHVTGREETARKLGGGGDSVTIAPVISVQYTSEQGSETSENDARVMAGTIKAIVIDTIKDQMRPNGLLAGAS